MKTKMILIVMFLFSILAVKGQNGEGDLLQKCYIDSKTGDTIRETKWKNVNFSPKYLLNFRMRRVNSVFTLELGYNFGASEPFFVAKGDSIWIKFIGGFKFTLYSNDSATSYKGATIIPGGFKGAVTMGVKVKYNLSQQQVLGFTGNEVEKVRIFSSKGYMDINWPEPSHEGLNPPPGLTVQAANLLLEKRKKYKILEPGSEDIKVNKEGAKTDEF